MARCAAYQSPSADGRSGPSIDAFGNYAPGRWCWHLTEVESFKKPVAIKGAQGWWRWAPAGQLITAKGRAY
jgi:hypothetical protein